MNRVLVTCALTLVAASAIAADFNERVTTAKRAEGSPQGVQYLQILGPAYGAAMRACLPPASSASENLGKFELVADVASDGRLLNVDIRPVTRVSRCFAGELAAQTIAAPPKDNGVSTYPIYLAMEVAP